MKLKTLAARAERSGPLETVILVRPNIRDAGSRTMADALVEASGQFERDSRAGVGEFRDGGTVYLPPIS